MKSILFYGDSNTWGFDPASKHRYPYALRWTSICAALMGEYYICIPAGMNGRTTAFDDPVKGARNGVKGLDYELQTHKPLDLLVVMLGTNDLKYTDSEGSAAGMERLVELARTANARFNLSSPVFPLDPAPILLVSPILLKAHVGARENDIAQSTKLSALYQRITEQHGGFFMDAARYAEASDVDGVHLAVDGHKKLGEAIAGKIEEIFSGEKAALLRKSSGVKSSSQNGEKAE